MSINTGLLFAAAVLTIDVREGEEISIPDHFLSQQETSTPHKDNTSSYPSGSCRKRSSYESDEEKPVNIRDAGGSSSSKKKCRKSLFENDVPVALPPKQRYLEKEESFREELRSKQNALIDLQIKETEMCGREAAIQLRIAEINLEIAENKLKVSKQELKEYERNREEQYYENNNRYKY